MLSTSAFEQAFRAAHEAKGGKLSYGLHRIKGSPPHVVDRGELAVGVVTFSFRGRKLCKLLGRISHRNSAPASRDAAALDSKIHATWPGFVPWQPQWNKQEVAIQEALDECNRADGDIRIHNWKNRMEAGGPRAHAWIKADSSPQSSRYA